MGTVLCSVSNERPCVRAVLSGPGLEEPSALPMSVFVSWKIRHSLSNVFFTYCFPPVHTFPTKEREGHHTARTAACGRGALGRALRPGTPGSPGSQPLLPGCPYLLGRSRPLRGARSLRGPVGLVAVSFRCGALKESLRRPRPAKTSTRPTSPALHRGCLFLRPPRARGLAGQPRLAPQAGHGRPART